ncbi:unnamed protein product [Protopolystoma xenopodis]|uniref:Uncharacterized protein n=1 Tax=Protopolystoma xenopodis TaxID=117903 RepID=A0A3S5B8Q8_9PLAT|nr:unnamed protein product [Protopolystoma xenopodis]
MQQNHNFSASDRCDEAQLMAIEWHPGRDAFSTEMILSPRAIQSCCQWPPSVIPACSGEIMYVHGLDCYFNRVRPPIVAMSGHSKDAFLSSQFTQSSALPRRLTNPPLLCISLQTQIVELFFFLSHLLHIYMNKEARLEGHLFSSIDSATYFTLALLTILK